MSWLTPVLLGCFDEVISCGQWAYAGACPELVWVPDIILIWSDCVETILRSGRGVRVRRQERYTDWQWEPLPPQFSPKFIFNTWNTTKYLKS
jgi:hypothetical protein